MATEFHDLDTLPCKGRSLPMFTLPATTGESVRLWQFKQRRPVLLAVLPAFATSGSRDWLMRLSGERTHLAELDVAVLVIARQPLAQLRQLQAEADMPFTLLADEDGTVTAKYLPAEMGAEAAGVYVADRYLQCLDRWIVADARGLPDPQAMLTPIATADMEDCSCGLPAWPEVGQ